MNNNYTVELTEETRMVGGVLDGTPMHPQTFTVFNVYFNGEWVNATRDADTINELIADHQNPGRWANVGSRFD